MARTDVSIVNIALSRLGVTTPITALTDTTSEQAIQANLIYETVRDSLVSEYPWRFATKHAPLSEVMADLYQTEYSYVYSYPSDCLRILRVYSEGTEFDDGRHEHEVYLTDCMCCGGEEQKVIATDLADAHADYIAQVTDPEQFSPLFADCLSWRLAAELSVPLARDFDKRQHLMEIYMHTLDSAREVDMQEGYRRWRKSGGRYASKR